MAIGAIGAALITGAVAVFMHLMPVAPQPGESNRIGPALSTTSATEAPACVDTRSGCGIDDAHALFVTAEQLDRDGKPEDAQKALVEAVRLYDVLLRLNPEQNGPSLVPAVIRALVRIGVDFSVTEVELRNWLANPDHTLYPVIAQALLRSGWRLKAPVFLDVIVWNYEQTQGVTTLRNVAQVVPDALKTAVLDGSNVRHETRMTDFDQLLQP